MPRKAATKLKPPVPQLTTNQLRAAHMLLNRRSLRGIFGNAIDVRTDQKHANGYDFGYPETLTFEHFYRMYTRNGIARGGVQRIVDKCWQDFPWLLVGEEPHDETDLEREVRQELDRLQFWPKVKELDLRARVGQYAGLIFRFADGQRFAEPVDRVAGLPALVDLIPAYEGQLTVSQWDTDEMSLTYGQPTMYVYQESAITDDQRNPKMRMFNVHPDRVYVWSQDGTVTGGESCLRAGFNDLINIEKIIGSSGEGFWKNAKSAPVLNVDKDSDISALAAMLGVEVSGIADKLDEVVADWQRGFDQLLMLQGIEAKTLGVTLPQPEEFLSGALQSFCASIPIPMKILVGSQTGERASTEDSNEWAETCQARRNTLIKPHVMRIVRRLVNVGVLPEQDWFLSWSDLTEASMEQKIERADKMAAINQKMMGRGQVFDANEIREVIGLESIVPDDGGDLPDDVDGAE